jgi:uracil-DNA glycosylase family 4
VTVPSEFPAKTPCKLAFVAEAPGAEEVAEGRPLIGPSGRVYNALLRTAGIDRAEVFTGNVFDEKAPGNNVGPWMRDPAIFNPALARLEAEITKADPTVIVPMGAPALWAFTGRDDISSFRGTVSLAEIVAKGRKILPTFHPAFVMRQWKFYTVVAQDFMRAQEEANMGPHIVLPKKRLIVEPTLPEVEAWCERCLAEPGPLSVDIETGWGQITCIGIAPNAEEALCIPFVDLRLPNRSYWDTAQEEATAWRAVQKVLESPVPKLGQNYGGYDAFMLLEVQGVRTMNFSEDTRLLHHNLYPELPKDLAFMGASYTRQGAWKHWGWRGRNKRDD